MGWSELADGGLDGDGPADAMAAGLKELGAESMRRIGRLPSGQALLDALVAALNLDGARAPFHSDPRRIAAIVVRHRGKKVRIDGAAAEDWIVAELYATLDEIAEEYASAWNRAPHLREVLHYLELHLEVKETFASCISDRAPWVLRDAKLLFRKERKGADRAPAPEPSAAPVHSLGRVTHPKFGEGIVVGAVGDHLTVKFGREQRVLLRAFVTPLES